MSALRRLVAALDAYTATLARPDTRSQRPATAREAVDRLHGHIYKSDPTWPTIEQVQATASRIYSELGADQLGFALQRIGVTSGRVKDMWIGSYKRWCADGEAMCDIRGDFALSYRWLLYHPESDCLFLETEPVAARYALSEGHVGNVTGMPDYEARFYEERAS